MTMHLNAFLMSTGHHEASWRLPESDPRANTNMEHYRDLARIAERGTFDSIFLADSPSLSGAFIDSPSVASAVGHRPAGSLEPTILLTAIAAVTSRIGLIATASTTYNDPFNLARRLAALDHVSGGRAGWNIVTTATSEAARNFGLDRLPSHGERYARAEEFVDVARALWDSWNADAVVADKLSGLWADGDKVHAIDHAGTHFRVAGPLNQERSPQGHPVLVQAGSSNDGRRFASKFADAVFTAQQTLEDAQNFYTDMKKRAAAYGREVKILPGIVPVIGATEAAARDLEDELDQLIVPDYARGRLAALLRVAPEDLPFDQELPADLPGEEAIQGAKSRYSLVVSMARRERLTVRQLIGRLGGGRGHRTFTGTPEQVADAMQHWVENGAADGFNVMPAVLPSGLEVFVDHVVPILRERGMFRREYLGCTLRDHLGMLPHR